MYVCVCVFVCVHIYIYIYKCTEWKTVVYPHTDTHTHTHTNRAQIGLAKAIKFCAGKMIPWKKGLLKNLIEAPILKKFEDSYSVQVVISIFAESTTCRSAEPHNSNINLSLYLNNR